MDAVEFFKKYKRMCKKYSIMEYEEECAMSCPMFDCHNAYFCRKRMNECNDDVLEDTIDLVEKWSDEHPQVTNLQKFKEVFGKIPMPYEGDINGMHVSWWAQEYTGHGA